MGHGARAGSDAGQQAGCLPKQLQKPCNHMVLAEFSHAVGTSDVQAPEAKPSRAVGRVGDWGNCEGHHDGLLCTSHGCYRKQYEEHTQGMATCRQPQRRRICRVSKITQPASHQSRKCCCVAM